MSRLADVSDLKLQLQILTGIASSRMQLCTVEEIAVCDDAAFNAAVRTYKKATMIPDKEGPCVSLIISYSDSDDGIASDFSPLLIYVFESTLNPRPSKSMATKESTSETSACETQDEDDIEAGDETVEEILDFYEEESECRVFDTDILPLAKAMSRRAWPTSASDLILGLRVDAKDRQGHWYPGSVVEINLFDGGRFRVHFDNFTAKWDEIYSMHDINLGRVQPIYSHVNPRKRPTEFFVYQSFKDKSHSKFFLFGQPFLLQCHSEWTTARAGAHILAQVARFLEAGVNDDKNGGDYNGNSIYENLKELRVSDELCTVISEIIGLLLGADRTFIRKMLSRRAASGTNEATDALNFSVNMVQELRELLPLLPFTIQICSAKSIHSTSRGNDSIDASFPFSLVQTIGNVMNAHHIIVFRWREGSDSSYSPGLTYMYRLPQLFVHPRNRALLSSRQDEVKQGSVSKLLNAKNNAHGAISLSLCLGEFCKEQHLGDSECWRCPKCKDFREGVQSMTIWRLPDLLIFHLKRFNCSAEHREKITSKVNFPLTGLNMKEWCDDGSSSLHEAHDSYVYDLIGAVNHHGGMTGGHYIAMCKATACGPDGSEEVAYNFNGAGVYAFDYSEEAATTSSGWVNWAFANKDKDLNDAQARAALSAAHVIAESSEPMWLQFDDDLVEPVPPSSVVSCLYNGGYGVSSRH